MTRVRVAAVVVFVGLVTAGCSSSDDPGGASPNATTSASPSTSPRASPSSSPSAAAVCVSVEGLEASVAELQEVEVTQNGLNALEQALATIGTDVQQVVDDAKDQYAPQTDELRTDYAALQSAFTTAQQAPTADSLSAVGSAIRTLGDDVRDLANDVAATC